MYKYVFIILQYVMGRGGGLHHDFYNVYGFKV